MAIVANPVVSRLQEAGVMFIEPTFKDNYIGGAMYDKDSSGIWQLTALGRKYSRNTYGGERNISFSSTTPVYETTIDTPVRFLRVERTKFQAVVLNGSYGFQNIEHNPWSGVTFTMKRKVMKTVVVVLGVVIGPPTITYEYQTVSYAFSSANNPILMGTETSPSGDVVYKNSLEVDGPVYTLIDKYGTKLEPPDADYTLVTYTTVSETIDGIPYPLNWYVDSIVVPPFYYT